MDFPGDTTTISSHVESFRHPFFLLEHHLFLGLLEVGMCHLQGRILDHDHLENHPIYTYLDTGTTSKTTLKNIKKLSSLIKEGQKLVAALTGTGCHCRPCFSALRPAECMWFKVQTNKKRTNSGRSTAVGVDE